MKIIKQLGLAAIIFLFLGFLIYSNRAGNGTGSEAKDGAPVSGDDEVRNSTTAENQDEVLNADSATGEPETEAALPPADAAANEPDAGMTEAPAATASVESNGGQQPAAVSVISPPPAAATPKPPATAVKTEAMKNSNDPLLEKLVEYETCCGNAFTRMMVFEYMPLTADEGMDMARDMALRLAKFSAAGVAPIVTVEPVDKEGRPLSFADIGSGKYDAALRAYFKILKGRGVSAAQMGMWIPLPEPNIDEWGANNRDPAKFAAAFNRYGTIFKEYFAAAKLAILLDNTTYNHEIDDAEYVSLVPFLGGIDKSLVDSFGLQGYPWTAPADEEPEKYHDYDPASFLNAQRAIEAAIFLETESVWFSTGTFSRMFANDEDKTVVVDINQRQAMLDGILEQVKIVRDAGYAVMMCIFAEDKSLTEEATDFSYWGGGTGINDESGKMFSEFVAAAVRENITLGVYDSTLD